MLKSFVLHDAGLNDKRIGKLLYNTETKQFSMSIDKNISANDLPLSLELLVYKGITDISHDDTIRWVRARICPPGRHNIREILSEIGLAEYDEFGILVATEAKCDKDDVYMKPEFLSACLR